MSDYIVRAISTDGLVQAAAICSRELTERARQIHHASPLAPWPFRALPIMETAASVRPSAAVATGRALWI